MSIVTVLIIFSCNLTVNEYSDGSGSTTSEVTMDGSFKISVSPGSSVEPNLISKAIITDEFTVTSMDITVTKVSDLTVAGTYQWLPANGLTTYDVTISGYGEYEIKVVQNGVDFEGKTITIEDTAAVNVELGIITVVTIIPGGTLTISIETSSSSSSGTSNSSSSLTMFGPFTENFDDEALGEIPDGWKSYYSASEGSIVGTVNNLTTQPVSSPNCLKMYDGSTTSGAGINIYLQESNYGQFKFDIKHASSIDKSQTGVVIKDTSSNDIINFLMNNSNMINVKRPDGTRYNFLSYNRDTWYTCQINWDRITGYYKILIDNVEYGIFPMMNNGAIYRINYFTGSGSDSTYFNCTSYIDNLVYTTDAISIDGSLSGTFTENFDSTAIGSLPAGFYQTAYPNVNCEVTTEITAHSAPNCLKIYDNNLTESASFVKDFATSETYGQFTYYFYMPSSSPWAGTVIDGLSGRLINIFFQAARVITLYDTNGSLIAAVGNYTADTWNKLTIKWDAATYKFKILLNDADYGAYSFMSNSIPTRLRFITQGLDAGHLNYYDDISFTKNAETIN